MQKPDIMQIKNQLKTYFTSDQSSIEEKERILGIPIRAEILEDLETHVSLALSALREKELKKLYEQYIRKNTKPPLFWKNKTFHYINLTNGIEAIPELPEPIQNRHEFRFLRIQSTVCEQHLWNKLLLELSDDLLMNLALGHTCIIYDYGARKPIPKAIYLGVAFIRYVLARRWLAIIPEAVIERKDGKDITCNKIFDHYYRNLSRPAKRKIDYFLPYLHTDAILLYAATNETVHDNEKDYYRAILTPYAGKEQSRTPY